VTEIEEQLLRQENIHLRQQAHYYQSLHARAVAKLQDLEEFTNPSNINRLVRVPNQECRRGWWPQPRPV
jgi:hypothetical protein